ncbi:S53 family peptidase [Bradyrhizobium sp.]
MSPSVELLGPDIATGAVLTNHASPAQATSEAFPASSMPPLPFVRIPAGGGSPQTIGEGQRVKLLPGNYAALMVKRAGVLILQPGNYSFSSAVLEQSSRVVALTSSASGAAGVVHIRILGRLTANAKVAIGLIDQKFKKPVDASYLKLSVYGADAGDGVAGKSAAYFGPGSRIHALVAVPHGTLWLEKGASALGAFAAFDIAVRDGVDIGFQGGLPKNVTKEQGSQQLAGYVVPSNMKLATIVGPIPADATIQLAIGLPVRAPPGKPTLKKFIRSVSDPMDPDDPSKVNPNFRHYLTQADFIATYGASSDDYDALRQWATNSGLTIKTTFASNLLLSVSGTPAQIEQALHVYLVLRRRFDGGSYVSVDREPSLDLSTPVLHISGLTSYIKPQHALVNGTGGTFSNGPSYRAGDLRAAYLGAGFFGAMCSKLDGTGQVVGIVDFDIFNPNDIAAYDGLQIPQIPNNVSVAVTEKAFNGKPLETTLDVSMVQAMAPGASVLLFQGNSGITLHLDDIFHSMANSVNPLTVASSSLIFRESDNTQQALDQMAAQGVSFFTASGDYGDVGDPQNNLRMDNQTLVGGTILSTKPLTAGLPAPSYPNNFFAGLSYYGGETAWNVGTLGSKNRTGGGVMDGSSKVGLSISGSILDNGPGECNDFIIKFCGGPVQIPWYQIAVQTNPNNANGGSTTSRNYPDVAMVADNIEIFFGSLSGASGTSAAAPLWAGFTALANQRSVAAGGTTMGFLNPTIYDIGQTRGTARDLYVSTFNDISDGTNNFNGFGNGFPAVAGYDLVTGWGSPTCNLLIQLATPAPLTNVMPLVLLEITIGTGNDDLRDDSEAKATITVQADANFPERSFDVTLHPSGSGAWQAQVVTISGLAVPNPGPQVTLSSPVKSVTITLISHNNQETDDNWNITSVGVDAYNPGTQHVCQINVAGNANLDGDTGLVRLTGEVPSATFAAGGC